jgi:hypothetical protein
MTLAACAGESTGVGDGTDASTFESPDTSNRPTADVGLQIDDADTAADSESPDSGLSAGSCTDGVKSGDETDVDCGGSCEPCLVGQGCTVARDCAGSEVDCTDAVCTCDEGYGPSDEGLCEDLDECAPERSFAPCAAGADCTNTVGGYICECVPPLVGDGVTCAAASPCTADSADCDANATCADLGGGVLGCVCDAGYAGDGTTCEDIAECADPELNDCDALAGCSEVDGGYDCGDCPDEYDDVGGGGSLCLPFIPFMFAHSSSTLYSVDPISLVVEEVGRFSGCTGEVIDLAIDRDQKAVVTTFSGIYDLDLETASCTRIASGSYPNSLSFVPAGTLEPDREVLVGYDGSSYLRIDRATGAITTIGSIGASLSSSGDIVSSTEGGTFLTVNGADCPGFDDCIIEVDPTTGRLVTNWGSIGHSDVYGLAYWAGVAYGFSADRTMFSITFDELTGRATTATLAAPDVAFYGAGSTTIAPGKN